MIFLIFIAKVQDQGFVMVRTYVKDGCLEDTRKNEAWELGIDMDDNQFCHRVIVVFV